MSRLGWRTWPRSGQSWEKCAREKLLWVLETRQREQAKREAYAALVAELVALGEERTRAERETQAGFDAALIAAATPPKGKPPKDANAAFKKLPEDRRKAVRAAWVLGGIEAAAGVVLSDSGARSMRAEMAQGERHGEGA